MLNSVATIAPKQTWIYLLIELTLHNWQNQNVYERVTITCAV